MAQDPTVEPDVTPAASELQAPDSSTVAPAAPEAAASPPLLVAAPAPEAAAPPAAAAPAETPAPATETPAPAAGPATPPAATPAPVEPTPAPEQPATPEPIGVPADPKKGQAPNTENGTAGCPGRGKLVGTVVTASSSTSTSGCAPIKKNEKDEDDKNDKDEDAADDEKKAAAPTPAPIERADGSPTTANPTYSLATPGPAAIGVPNFFIDKFRIPPFLLPIYQAAGIQYGVRWEVLAAINEIETDYGRNLNISSAGALGWMQFMPATWDAYGVDANRDGLKDPFNPVDAIFAAARYLRAAGAEQDLRRAIFAYNHADWYVDSVLMRARVIGGLPVGPRRLAHRPDPGPLPRRRQGRLRPGAQAHPPPRAGRRERRLRGGVRRAAPRHPDLRPLGRPGGRRQRRPRRPRRPLQAARALRRAPGRLRQHVHLREARRGLLHLSRAARAPHLAARDPPRARPPEPDRPPPAPPPGRPARTSAKAARRPAAAPPRQGHAHRARRGHRRPPSSVSSPTRPARGPRTPAATSSSR